jgi:hypothetical protein
MFVKTGSALEQAGLRDLEAGLEAVAYPGFG